VGDGVSGVYILGSVDGVDLLDMFSIVYYYSRRIIMF